MPYLLQLVSPNDSAKVRKIFRPANFLHSGSYWDIRDNVNQGPSKFPRMPVSATHRTARETFNLFRILSFRLELHGGLRCESRAAILLFILAIRSLLRLA